MVQRAGHYALQPGGHRTFMPAPLPPEPPVHFGGELPILLSRADRALGRLDGSIRFTTAMDGWGGC